MNRYSRLIAVLAAVLVLALSVLVVCAAGGRIEGKVTDPKGAAVVGAAVSATVPDTNQTFTATTDAQGRYKIEGLPPGIYAVVVSASGFGEGRVDNVKVDEGATATCDVRLEIAAVEAEVTVNAGGLRPNTDSVYQKLRQQAKNGEEFAGPYASVTNLVLKRDAATFTLKSGEIYFVGPIDGRTVGAVFLGEGQLTLTPPTIAEKHSLSLFIDQQNLDESFDKLVLRFTDKTFAEIQASAQVHMGTGGPQAARARDAYRDNQLLLRKTLRRNLELRSLIDLYNPRHSGFFTAFIEGRRYKKLIFQYDPRGVTQVSPEEVLLLSYGDTDGGLWTAFHKSAEYANGTASSGEEHRVYDIVHHEIEGTIRGTKLTANDTVTIRLLDPRAQVLPFSLFAPLRVTRVRDELGRDLEWIQERKEEDAELAIIWPEAMEAFKNYKLNIEYAGSETLIDVGGGNFFINGGARATWYPNNEATFSFDRATFNVSFRYAKGETLIGTGTPVAPAAMDGDLMLAKWTSGDTAMAVAGFNYGLFRKKEVLDKSTGYNIEFYGNEETQRSVTDLTDSENGRRTMGSMSTLGMAGSMLADAQNATRLYNAYFGKLPFNRLALTQQPAGNFGQAWPTLVYMPFTAFMDRTQRMMASGNIHQANNNFFAYVAPHEIAHQWWGHMVGWKSYRDQWMSEGFAEFSASLYIQYVLRDEHKYLEFWNDQRDRITLARPATHGLKPYTIGPVTQGYRLGSAKTNAAYQFLVYPKGAYILHMLRQMMFDEREGGDKLFKEMMQDFVKSHYNQDVSTEDLKQIVEKHMTKKMDLSGNGTMDWFFNEWVYGTEMPAYRFDYKVGADGSLSGHVTQSGVSDNFAMPVPLYADFGKGWVKLGSVVLRGNTTVDLTDIKLPGAPRKVAICALADVLAVNIQNSK
jgi:hypothetical protein